MFVLHLDSMQKYFVLTRIPSVALKTFVNLCQCKCLVYVQYTDRNIFKDSHQLVKHFPDFHEKLCIKGSNSPRAVNPRNVLLTSRKIFLSVYNIHLELLSLLVSRSIYKGISLLIFPAVSQKKQNKIFNCHTFLKSSITVQMGSCLSSSFFSFNTTHYTYMTYKEASAHMCLFLNIHNTKHY